MPAPDKLSGDRALLRFLVRHGRLSPDDATRLEGLLAGGSGPIYELLAREAGVSQAELAGLLSQHLRLPLIDLVAFPLDLETGRTLKENLALRCNAVPLQVKDQVIELACANPLDVEAIRAIEFATSRRVRLLVARFSEVRDALQHIYRLEESLDQYLKKVPAASALTINQPQEEPADLRVSLKDAELPPIVRLVDLVITEAIKSSASDIHIEPSNDTVSVRYRVDGVLEERFAFPKWVQNPLMARIKVLAKLDITERRVPQDGHLHMRFREGMVDLRVSSLPAQHGEKITIRVLDPNGGAKRLTEIGLSENDLVRVREAITRPEGMILVTGPTGSGKTSTLYAFIREIWSPTLNIVTIENPIEYQVRGITQVEVNPKQGLTFPSVIRSILRQDPDVILVGEIRDAETARIAFQAAQTGHLVFSTLHTNDAVATITRLGDLGIEPYTIASSLNLVIAQRLVRRICSQCQQPSQIPDEAKRLLRLLDSGIEVYRGAGCADCRQTGYRGRVGVFEVLPVTASIAQHIESRSPESAIRRQAKLERCATLQDDALLKIAAGVTTPDEVLRVVQIAEVGVAEPPPLAAVAGRSTRGAVAESTTVAPEPPKRTSKALVVDDDPDLRRIVRTMIERSGLGLTVITAQDGEEALTLVEVERPDIVVLDVAMPGVDGFEVCRQLRANPQTESVPVVLLTARDAAEDVTRGFREGADDYVIKPFHGEELIARIRRMIQRTYGAAEAAPMSSATVAPAGGEARLSGATR
jgi:type IV pilus assembly protein PilB